MLRGSFNVFGSLAALKGDEGGWPAGRPECGMSCAVHLASHRSLATSDMLTHAAIKKKKNTKDFLTCLRYLQKELKSSKTNFR